MPRNERYYHENFKKYVNFIVNQKAYEGLPIKKDRSGKYRFVATKKSKIGKQREEWIKNKAEELKFKDEKGVYAQVMRHIHPTKETVCQICGSSMSIYYHYLGKNAVDFFENEYGFYYTIVTHIGEVWDEFIHYGFTEEEIGKILLNKCNISEYSGSFSKDEIIETIEDKCRRGECKFLGPGAMSDAPDRFDGFHSYNRCCREKEDLGRHRENMQSYGRDRRAYERWSDGNIRAANRYMHSKVFKGNSADHIGPISLGFVHDPRYLRPMASGKNSARNNNLSLSDVKKLIKIENETGVCAISWYSNEIWQYIKNNYLSNKTKIGTEYKKALQQNFANFMQVLYLIIMDCGDNGRDVLAKLFLEPNYECFKYNYEFGANGKIVKQSVRRKTEACKNEFNTYKRIALTAVIDYVEKENRNFTHSLQQKHIDIVHTISKAIKSGETEDVVKDQIINVMSMLQKEIIKTL